MNVMWAALFYTQEGKCFYCDAAFVGKAEGKLRKHPQAWTKEHVRPQHKGYRDPHNVVLACTRCNTAKGGRDPTVEELRRMHTVHAVALEWVRRFWSPTFEWPDPDDMYTARLRLFARLNGEVYSPDDETPVVWSEENVG